MVQIISIDCLTAFVQISSTSSSMQHLHSSTQEQGIKLELVERIRSMNHQVWLPYLVFSWNTGLGRSKSYRPGAHNGNQEFLPIFL